MTSAEILARLSTLARADVGDFIDIDGDTPKVDLKQAKRRGKLPTLRKLKQAGDRVEIEIHNPIQALEKLGHFRGMWKDKPPTDTYANANPDDAGSDIEPSPDQGTVSE